jgi:hypothetical protein
MPLAFETRPAQFATLGREAENREIPMPEYVAGLCRMEGSELVPFDTIKFFADNHDEAMRHAVGWLSSTDTALVIDPSPSQPWLARGWALSSSPAPAPRWESSRYGLRA